MKLRKDWEEHFRNPPPGSKAFEAKEFGIDMAELIVNLKLSPTERLEKLQRKMNKAYAKGMFYDHYPAWDLNRKPK
jgi:hypothetical protein